MDFEKLEMKTDTLGYEKNFLHFLIDNRRVIYYLTEQMIF